MNESWELAPTVSQLLALRAAHSPQTPAFVEERGAGQWEPISWQAFATRARQLSRGLYAAGLRRGDRLALIAPVSLEWELMHHAALAAGVVVVGLDAHDLPVRIANMVEQADITAFATAEMRALSGLGQERLRAMRLLVRLGAAPETPGLQSHDLEALEALGGAALMEPPAPAPEDIATIVFTSGTTGAPKGIAYSHGQLRMAVEAVRNAYSFVGPEGRLLCWLPLSNLLQRMVSLAGMRQGTATYLLGDPRRIMDVVATVSPDIFVGVPRFYEKLYEGIKANIAAQPALPRRLANAGWGIARRAAGERRAGRQPSPWLRAAERAADRLVLSRIRAVMGTRLRCMVTGSAPISRHLLEEFDALGWPVLEAYGLSENILPMAANGLGATRFGSVGRPLAGNEIVVGPEGAIKVRGPGLFHGYLGEETASAIDAQGFYLTGDLGRFDSDGFLFLTGRSSEIIKTSTGRRVAPAGAEAQLRGVDGIDEVVLIGAGRKCLVALCTCATATAAAIPREVLEFAVRERVAEINEHERPLAIGLLQSAFSLENGELTPNLKLRRAAIEIRHADFIQQLYERVDQANAPGGLVIV